MARLIQDLATIRPTPRHWVQSTGWSLANWVLDAACLWAACTAVGVHDRRVLRSLPPSASAPGAATVAGHALRHSG
ncbi:MAG: hypothetical protein ABIR83_15390 [Nakamurella sp.]